MVKFMAASVDYFAQMGFPREYSIDLTALEKRYIALCQSLHPDRYGDCSSSFASASEEKASLVNQAYNVLIEPVERAEHLLHLFSGPAPSESRTVSADALEFQLEWRERLAELGGRGDLGYINSQLVIADAEIVKLISRLEGLFPKNGPEPDPDWRRDCREILNIARFIKTIRASLFTMIDRIDFQGA